jgi:hypothetical protein
MAGRSLGNLRFENHILGYAETAVRYSFEARRGTLYQALRALNALLIVDLAKQATVEDFTQREYEEMAWKSLENQMEEELKERFRFAYVVGMARRKFKDLDGAMGVLDRLVPEFTAEYETRAAAGKLGRKGGVLRWSTGTQEVGCIQELLKFATASLQFAQHVLDEDSAFHHLEAKADELRDALP